MLENVLMECTSYQVAGQPMSKATSDQLEEEIAEAVLQVLSRAVLQLLFIVELSAHTDSLHLLA